MAVARRARGSVGSGCMIRCLFAARSARQERRPPKWVSAARRPPDHRCAYPYRGCGHRCRFRLLRTVRGHAPGRWRRVRTLPGRERLCDRGGARDGSGYSRTFFGPDCQPYGGWILFPGAFLRSLRPKSAGRGIFIVPLLCPICAVINLAVIVLIMDRGKKEVAIRTAIVGTIRAASTAPLRHRCRSPVLGRSTKTSSSRVR
jgi:hypothetical protein